MWTPWGKAVHGRRIGEEDWRERKRLTKMDEDSREEIVYSVLNISDGGQTTILWSEIAEIIVLLLVFGKHVNLTGPNLYLKRQISIHILINLKPVENSDMLIHCSFLYITSHGLVPLTTLGLCFGMPPHQAANWIRLTGTIDNCQDSTLWTELPLNLTLTELTLWLSMSPAQLPLQ